jgi:hypothetical protein
MTRLCQACISFLMMYAGILQAAEIVLQDHLGHSWTRERVTFPLTPDQADQVAGNRALTGPNREEVSYQLLTRPGRDDGVISFQTDLAPFERRSFQFEDHSATAITDLRLEETARELRVENKLIGLAIRKTLEQGQGPVAAIRLRNGDWTGDSSLQGTSAVAEYSARVTQQGPVLIEIQCKLVFADGGWWSLRFRIENGEPVVLIRESFDAPGEGVFRLSPGSEAFRPDHMLYRSGKGGNLGQVNKVQIGSGKAFILEPWLHWWENERQGNWFALYSEDPPEPSRSDLLMIGLLRPSEWKDPDWSGSAPHVPLKVPAERERGLFNVSFPLGGGNRVWMLGTPERIASLSILAEKNRKKSPLPQQYLIKHGDFPLDVVKDYVLQWDGDHDNYPRLLLGKQDLAKLGPTLDSDPRQLDRWENRQAIDKYNIGDPLREYFASGSEKLGNKMIARSLEWLDRVVHEDLMLQNSRSTLGIAPHNQAVLLLPTINLSDAALGVESLTEEQRLQILAKLAFLAYVVNRDDYWSPSRGFGANPNMSTTVAHYQVALASLIPSHPMAQQWAKRGLNTLSRQLMEWSDEDGGWLEAPHYAIVSYDHMLAAFLMAARAGFTNYLYEERMRKVVEWLAQISTPPDAHTQGFRHLPPIGNTYFGESTNLFCIVAGVWKEQDPQFAGQMQWMCDQHGAADLGLGWSFPSMTGYKDLIMDPEIAAKKPEYGSKWFRNTGVVLRNEPGTGRETWLHLIAGSNHEHYDHDSGSIVLWGKGRVLADDWGYIGRHGEEFHSLLSSFLTRGNMHITAFSTQTGFDYVSGNKGPWQRQIGFVRDHDPLGPNFFLIRDSHHLEMPAEWRLWLTVQSDPDAIRIHPEGAHIRGQDDVDLDLFFFEAESLDLKTEVAQQRVSVGSRDGKTGPLTLHQTALIASLENIGAVTVLAFPRLRSEPSPRVIWHAGGTIAEVVSETGTDYVFLASGANHDPQKKYLASGVELSVTGDAGSVQVRSDEVRLTLGAAGTLHYDGKTLIAKTASSETHVP